MSVSRQGLRSPVQVGTMPFVRAAKAALLILLGLAATQTSMAQTKWHFDNPGLHQWVVPKNSYPSVKYTALGGIGGSTHPNGGTGGSGATVEGEFPVQEGQTLFIWVAAEGANGGPNGSGAGGQGFVNGGNGGMSFSGNKGGGGGGSSAIWRAGDVAPIVVAGGGGGAGLGIDPCIGGSGGEAGKVGSAGGSASGKFPCASAAPGGSGGNNPQTAGGIPVVKVSLGAGGGGGGGGGMGGTNGGGGGGGASYVGPDAVIHTHSTPNAYVTLELLQIAPLDATAGTTPSERIVFGQPTRLWMKLKYKENEPYYGWPQGAVNFGLPGCESVQLVRVDNYSSMATCSTSDLGTPGLHGYAFNFTSNIGVFPPARAEARLVIQAAASTTSLTLPGTPVRIGDAVPIRTTVLRNTPSTGSPEGNVKFLANGVEIGTVPLKDGMADVSYTPSKTGLLSIVAQYQGSLDTGNSWATKPLTVD